MPLPHVPEDVDDSACGSACAPLPAVHDGSASVPAWAAAIARHFSQQQLQRLKLIAADVLDLGGDCTGANACHFALSACSKAMEAEHGFSFKICNKFGSEAPGRQSLGPRKFMTLNPESSPEVLFCDVTKRKAEGPCFWHPGRDKEDGARSKRKGGKGTVVKLVKQRISKVRLYQAGTVCRDISRANPHRQPLASSEGSSARTWQASIAYLRSQRPPFAFMENTYCKQT